LVVLNNFLINRKKIDFELYWTTNLFIFNYFYTLEVRYYYVLTNDKNTLIVPLELTYDKDHIINLKAIYKLEYSSKCILYSNYYQVTPGIIT